MSRPPLHPELARHLRAGTLRSRQPEWVPAVQTDPSAALARFQWALVQQVLAAVGSGGAAELGRRLPRPLGNRMLQGKLRGTYPITFEDAALWIRLLSIDPRQIAPPPALGGLPEPWAVLTVLPAVITQDARWQAVADSVASATAGGRLLRLLRSGSEALPVVADALARGGFDLRRVDRPGTAAVLEYRESGATTAIAAAWAAEPAGNGWSGVLYALLADLLALADRPADQRVAIVVIAERVLPQLDVFDPPVDGLAPGAATSLHPAAAGKIGLSLTKPLDVLLYAAAGAGGARVLIVGL